MRKLSADFIFPISSPPIENGVVIVDDKGTITDILKNTDDLIEVEFFEGVICPGFVNTHCHLELSHTKGLIPETTGLVGFIEKLQSERNKFTKEQMQQAIITEEQHMLNEGIVAVGDICNSAATFQVKANSKMYYHSFMEVFAFNPLVALDVYSKGKELIECYQDVFENSSKKPFCSIVPHSNYAVSTRLFKIIQEHANEYDIAITMHNQETQSEDELFYDGKGALKRMMERFGLDTSFWEKTNKNALLSNLNVLPKDQNLILVHNTFTDSETIKVAQKEFNNVYWCLCPNANLYIEDKIPPVINFIENNAAVTIGTDSLASNHSLSVLEELKTISKHFDIELTRLLQWATYNGAEALGFERQLGALEKGKSPGLVLIEKLDNNKLKLTNNSSSRMLMPAKF